jgi:hypothetical protein
MKKMGIEALYRKANTVVAFLLFIYGVRRRGEKTFNHEKISVVLRGAAKKGALKPSPSSGLLTLY